MEVEVDGIWVQKQIDNTRRKILISHMVMIICMLLMVVGTICYYEMKLRAVTGAVYQEDSAASKLMVQKLFSVGIHKADWDVADEAMKNAGYTENGFKYIFDIGGQKNIVITVLVVTVLLVLFALKMYLSMGKQSLYDTIQKLVKENAGLNNKLETAVIYEKKRNDQLQEFVENIAHQVKTPLTALGIAIDTNATKDECFFHIERIREFIQRLMNISRLESGKVIFAREDIVVWDMLQDVVRSVGMDECSIEIECSDTQYVINGDSAWLKECFINIVSNSVDYIRGIKGGKIVISAECRDDKCVICVTDNGSGFDESSLSELFDRFRTRGDAKAFHAGIGLNLAKLIVEAHNGHIYATNCKAHQGAEFRVVFPIYCLKKGKSVT